MNRRDFLSAAGAVALAPAFTQNRGRRPPNVVFILADDLGWRDTSLYGSKFYETPNITALAHRGLMFNQAYAAAPVCSPTRASIMTGMYPARLGIISPNCHQEQVILEQKVPAKGSPDRRAVTPNSVTRLKLEYFTLAEALKQAGYATGHFGKWHLGREPYDPLHQGFDVDVPHFWGPGPPNYTAPWRFPPSLKFQGEPGENLEDRMSSEASKFIRVNRDRPFFLNYWCFSVHSNWQAKEALVEKYRAKADPKDPQHHPVYAAMIETMDAAVGRLTRELEDAGVEQNTILIFFSDNGGVLIPPEYRMPNWKPLHAGFEGLPITSNLPLRGGKGTLYEGGTREPCVVVWPGVVKPGSRTDQIMSSVDFYPTILEVLGLKPEEGLKLDGKSIAAALRGHSIDRGPVFWHYPVYNNYQTPCTSVRSGDWKLIRCWLEGGGESDRLELYNLKDDIGETNDLANRMPEKARELNALIARFLEDTHAVVPKRNPAYNPNAPHARVPAIFEILDSDEMA